MPEDPKRLTFFETFVDKYFMRMPPAVRNFTYVLFVLVLVYAAYRAVGGDYAVGGRILEVENKQRRPAKNYEVRVGDRYFGTNSKGFYYIVLGPLDYAALLVNSEIELEILRGDYSVAQNKIAFLRSHGLFRDVEIRVGAAQEETPMGWRRPPPSPASPFVLQARPGAGESPLIVLSVLLQAGASGVRDGWFELVGKDGAVPLRATRSAGANAGRIPVVSGQWISFGNDYHFIVDKQRLGPAAVRFTSRTGYFSSYEESFPLEGALQPGRAAELRGERGSSLRVVLATEYEVILYDKSDIGGVRERLKAALLEKGMLSRERPAPLGSGSRTNALYAGRLVPHTAVQAAVEAAAAQGIPLKTVQCGLNLKSGNQNEIQIGGSRACDDAPPIPAADLKRLAGARSEAEFLAVQRPLASRCEAARRAAPRKR